MESQGPPLPPKSSGSSCKWDQGWWTGGRGKLQIRGEFPWIWGALGRRAFPPLLRVLLNFPGNVLFYTLVGNGPVLNAFSMDAFEMQSDFKEFRAQLASSSTISTPPLLPGVGGRRGICGFQSPKKSPGEANSGWGNPAGFDLGAQGCTTQKVKRVASWPGFHSNGSLHPVICRHVPTRQ